MPGCNLYNFTLTPERVPNFRPCGCESDDDDPPTPQPCLNDQPITLSTILDHRPYDWTILGASLNDTIIFQSGVSATCMLINGDMALITIVNEDDLEIPACEPYTITPPAECPSGDGGIRSYMPIDMRGGIMPYDWSVHGIFAEGNSVGFSWPGGTNMGNIYSLDIINGVHVIQGPVSATIIPVCSLINLIF